ncbi:superoxide dismutase [Deinococcus altitudinis]|uniref:superoxide dismutase n=1 Tax=Deinococcus altitudinis TaxID=468914 RepID=UPI0038915A58
MKNLILLSVGALALSACAPMMASAPYTLAPQAAAPAGIVPVGTVSASRSAATTITSARVTGLAANTYYVAHYHLMGNASTDPCKSGGPLIMSSMMVGQTDAAGTLNLSGTALTADIAGATYFNVHTSKDSVGTPADAGVACTPVTP